MLGALMSLDERFCSWLTQTLIGCGNHLYRDLSVDDKVWAWSSDDRPPT